MSNIYISYASNIARIKKSYDLEIFLNSIGFIIAINI